MKLFIKTVSVAALVIALLLTGCASASPEQGTLELDARVTEAPAAAEAPAEPAAKEEPAVETAAEETEEAAEEQEASVSYADALCAAFSETGALSTFAPFSETDIFDYYGIDPDQCLSLAAYTDTEGYCCELVIVEAEESFAEEVEALLQDYLDLRYEQFESYDADAAQLVKECVFRRDGGIVLMIVSPEAEALLSVYRAFEF